MTRYIANCPSCELNCAMQHLHNEVPPARWGHWVRHTHVEGSERFRCTDCGYTLTRPEAEARGIRYVFDVAPASR